MNNGNIGDDDMVVFHKFGRERCCASDAHARQIAVEYLVTVIGQPAAVAISWVDKGWVRAFRGSLVQFVAFLDDHELLGSELFFQDRWLSDDSLVSLEDYCTATIGVLVDELASNECVETYDDHLILFTSAGSAW